LIGKNAFAKINKVFLKREAFISTNCEISIQVEAGNAARIFHAADPKCRTIDDDD